LRLLFTIADGIAPALNIVAASSCAACGVASLLLIVRRARCSLRIQFLVFIASLAIVYSSTALICADPTCTISSVGFHTLLVCSISIFLILLLLFLALLLLLAGNSFFCQPAGILILVSSHDRRHGAIIHASSCSLPCEGSFH